MSSNSTSVFPVHAAPSLGGHCQTDATLMCQDNLNRITHELNLATRALQGSLATSFNNVSSIFKMFTNPILVKSIAHPLVDAAVFDDRYDINSLKSTLPPNSVQYRLNDLDGFTSTTFDVLVFDHNGIKLKKSEYTLRTMFASFHVLVRKYNSEGGCQQVFDNLPLTFVVMDKRLTTLDRPTHIAQKDEQHFQINKIKFDKELDPSYLYLYSRKCSVSSPLPDHYKLHGKNEYTISRNEYGDIQVSLTTPVTEKTEFLVINGSEYIDLSFDYTFNTMGDVDSVTNIEHTGLNFSPKNISVDDDNKLAFPLYAVHNCKVQPLRPIQAEEVLIWMQGVRLIPNVDFTVDSSLFPVQKIKIDREFLNMDSGEFKMIILRPLGENKSFYLGKMEFTDLEERGLIFSQDKRMNLPLHNKFVFNGRRLLSTDKLDIVDNRTLHVNEFFTMDNTEVVFDYVTSVKVENIIEHFMLGRDDFEHYARAVSTENETESDLAKSYLCNYVSRNSLQNKEAMSESVKQIVNYLDEVPTANLSQEFNLPLLVNENLIKAFFDKKDLDARFYDHIGTPILDYTVEHYLNTKEFFVVAMDESKRLIDYEIVKKDESILNIKFEEEFTGTIVLYPEFLSEGFKFAGTISSLEDAEPNSYVGTDASGEFGVHPIPTTLAIANPNGGIMTDKGEIDLTKSLIISLGGFRDDLSSVGGFKSTEIIIREDETGQVVYANEFPVDTNIDLGQRAVFDNLEPTKFYTVYARYLTSEGYHSDLTSVAKFHTPDIIFVTETPVITGIQHDDTLDRFGYITVNAPSNMDENSLVYTRVQIALDANFRSVIHDSIDNRLMLMNQVPELKLSVHYNNLRCSETYYVRASFEQRQTGYGDWSDPVRFRTSTTIRGELLDTVTDFITFQNTTSMAVNGASLFFITSRDESPIMEVMKYDIPTGNSIPVAPSIPSPDARKAFASISTANTFFMFGGIDQDGNFLNDLWKLNLITGQWEELKSSNLIEITGLANAAMTLNYHSKELYIGGGYNEESVQSLVYSFDLVSKILKVSEIELPSPRHSFVFSYAENQSLTVADGYSSNGAVIDDYHHYSLRSKAWTTNSLMTEFTAGGNSKYVTIDRRSILAVSGELQNGDSVPNVLETSLISAEDWMNLDVDLSEHSEVLAVASDLDKVYVLTRTDTLNEATDIENSSFNLLTLK